VADDQQDALRYSVLSLRTIWWAAAVILLAGIGVATWLLLAYGTGDPQERNQLEAIKTAGTIVIGTGGAAALLLAARRQRTAEIALKQKDQDQAHAARVHVLQERVASTTEADAVERRITDLYAKAVEQLGSATAPVRLGGLYALERLAQNNRGQRQTIANVLCAYLRMPYDLPEDLDDDASAEQRRERRERIEEREVRLAAQRILAEHQRADRPGEPETHWGQIDLNLTEAVLLNFDFSGCAVFSAQFDVATFIGPGHFAGTTFAGRTSFTGARFTEAARFQKTTFTEDAMFDSVAFGDVARFGGARLVRSTFRGARFRKAASFNAAAFEESTEFTGTHFSHDTSFCAAQFMCEANFFSTHFAGTTGFSFAAFDAGVHVDDARFDRGVPWELIPAVTEAQERRTMSGW
jgi:uncharacterized protein YjbI with pentapeptide repeats